MPTLDELNQRAAGHFPGYLGIVFTSADPTAVRLQCPVRPELMAPNGFLHGGAVASLADTCAGFACYMNLPDGATGYTTVELKTNFMGTATSGTVECVATAVHLGRSTHVWDVMVSHRETQKSLAVFRCTQLILYAQ